MPSQKLDSQVVEIIGRSRLIESILRADLEVALPQRDHGIDLIVFDEGDTQRRTQFRAIPIQLKSSSTQQFSIARRHEQFPDLRIAHVWNVHEPNAVEIYVVTHEESVRVGDQVGWTKTNSWALGAYSKRGIRAGTPIHATLAPYRIVTIGDWRKRLGFE